MRAWLDLRQRPPLSPPPQKPNMKNLPLTTVLIALISAPAIAQTTVTQPWVRGTVAQQMTTGAFMQITSAGGAKLISVSTPSAGMTQIHQMKMDGSTMQMRALPAGLDLPAGKAVELKPGGYHLMLMDLKAPLKAGDTVDLRLVIQARDGKTQTLVVKAPVRALGSSMAEPKP